MRRGLLIGLVALVVMALWAGGVFMATLAGVGRTPLAAKNDASAFAAAVSQRLREHRTGNAAFALLEDGRVVAIDSVSIGAPVDGDTLFQVASLSKWITAWGVMALVEQGKIDLDAPVSRYLTRWQLPASSYGNDGVTVRRLLSHTAGLTDGLGYGGFAPGTAPESLEASLTHAGDASPGHAGAVQVGAEPGKQWRYSGGGYTLLQLLIEEVTHERFNDYMRRVVLLPLGMERSTFVLEDGAANVAQFYDEHGAPATHFTFTALAAASLYTSTADLSRFLQANVAGPNGEPAGRGVLKPETLALMRRPHAQQFGADLWGLGQILYAHNGAGDFIVGHDGSNDPAINTTARVDPATGDGIVVLETGSDLLATSLGGDWVFWKSGELDPLEAVRAFPRMLRLIGAGLLAILMGAIVLIWAPWRRRRAPG